MIDAYKVGRRMDELGLTQESLAEKLGISRRTLNTYLTTGEVKKEKLVAPMAEALGVDVSWLFPMMQGSYKMATGIGNAIAQGNSTARSGSDMDIIIRLETENQQLRERVKSLEELLGRALERK